jgi:hypothetical protein
VSFPGLVKLNVASNQLVKNLPLLALLAHMTLMISKIRLYALRLMTS